MNSIQYLLDLAIILFAAKIFSVIGRKFGVPEVVGEILAGLVVGSAVLGVVKESDFLNIMAELGVIMLMFEAGLSTNLQELKKSGLKAIFIACGGVIVPLIMGTILFMSFYGFDAPRFMKGLFIGTIMSATSVSITVAVLKELGKLSDTVGTTIVSAAIIDDVLGIILLTIVTGLSGHGETETVSSVLLKVAAFFAGTIITGFIVYKFMSWLDNIYSHTRRIPIISLCYCFILAYVSETYFGIADITGAYVAGVILCNIADSNYVARRIDISSYMIFAPIFFAGIGLKTSFSSMDARLLMFSICFVIIALISKVIGCGGCARLMGFNSGDSLKIGTGMMTRGEVALITAQKGLAIGLLTADYFTAVILMILVSSIVTPMILKKEYV
ncbi:MAG: cation:proton antiporter [Synergistaceae bacterium]|nr:cation:proton antiporter [Synergistaceae bacterium]